MVPETRHPLFIDGFNPVMIDLVSEDYDEYLVENPMYFDYNFSHLPLYSGRVQEQVENCFCLRKCCRQALNGYFPHSSEFNFFRIFHVDSFRTATVLVYETSKLWDSVNDVFHHKTPVIIICTVKARIKISWTLATL